MSEKALAIDPNYEPAILNRQTIGQLREGEKLDAQILDVRYYEMKFKKEKKHVQ